MSKQHYKVFHFGILAEEQNKIVISNNLFIKKEEGIVTTTSTYYEISIDDINISLIEKNIWIIKKDNNIFLLRLINNIHSNHLDYTQQEFTSKDDLLQELYNYLNIHKETITLNNNYLIKAIKLKEIVTLTTNKERYICLNNNNITLDICKTNICDFYYTYAALKVRLTENECQQIESNNIPIIRNLFENNNFKCPGRSAVIEWLRLAKPEVYNNLQIVNKNENLIQCYSSENDIIENKEEEADDEFDYFFDPGPTITFTNEEDRLKHLEYLNIQCKIIEERRHFLLSKIFHSQQIHPADIPVEEEEEFELYDYNY